eukprot:1102619-Pyramimonas_sp.AAC.1
MGAVLFEARGLQVLYRVMTTTRHLTGLCLKVSKCKVTPFHAAFDPDLLASTRELLCRLVPDWQAFEIVAHLMYLGVLLGPD